MTYRFPRIALSVLCAVSFAGTALAHPETQHDAAEEIKGSDGMVLNAAPLETFDSAWAMTFLPDGRALVTEKTGAIWLLDKDGHKLGKIDNVPKVDARNQGGMGDIIIGQDFARSGTIYLSYVERDESDDSLSGAALEKAKLTLNSSGGRLSSRDVIWRQSPKVKGNGHYGHRLAVSPDGYLFISSGDRQKFHPAQNMDMNLGKIIRINPDGSIPKDNPFYGHGGVTDEIWSLGHRNPLGLAFDAKGNLWEHEMGPRDGDELNLIVRSENYGYPHVSEGEHYDGTKIPSHESMPIFKAPMTAWVPAISPAGFMIYDGDMFEGWQGNGFIGGLSSEALIRVTIEEDLKSRRKGFKTEEAGRYEWGKRIREIEQGPDGAIYVLEDDEGGRLLKLTPG